VIELALKALLRASGIDPPRVHREYELKVTLAPPHTFV